MTPPVSSSRIPTGSASTASTDTTGDWSAATLLLDSADAEHPERLADRWANEQAYRTSHPELFLALNALQAFFGGEAETPSAAQAQAIQDWVNLADPDEADRVALANLRRRLAAEPYASDRRARSVAEVLGTEAVPEASDAVSASSDAFELAALSLGFRFDTPHRDLVHGISVGALPATGVPGYNQAADVGLQLDGEFTWGNFRFFGGVSWNHNVIPASAPESRYEQAFLQFGLVEYGNLLAGRPEDGFFLASGRSRVGLGIGLRACTGFSEATAAAGAVCPEPTPQLALLGDSDLISVGYGPVELSLRLLSNPTYFNLGDSLLPSYGNLVPLEFSLIYHLNQPIRGGAAPSSITDAQAVYDALRVLTGTFQDNLSFRSEAALEETRILNVLGASGTVGAEGQYNLLNLGTFFGGVLRGVPAGTLAHEVRRDLEVGTTEQRVIVAAPLVLEPLIHGLVAAGSSRGDPSLPSLEEQAFYLSLPYMLTRDGLSILGAVGAFGNRDRAVEGDLLHQIHYLGAHGAFALGGLVMILASGDGSGNGFLANTILGNRRPALTGTDIAGTQWDLPAQREQYWRLSLGSMLLTYGASAILDFLTAPRTPAADESSDEEEAGTSTAALPIRIGLDTDGQTRGMVSVSGAF